MERKSGVYPSIKALEHACNEAYAALQGVRETVGEVANSVAIVDHFYSCMRQLEQHPLYDCSNSNSNLNFLGR